MSRGEKGVLSGTVLVVLLILVFDAIAPHEPDWRETYTRYKRAPYACGLVYDRLGDLFHHGITTVREPIYSTAQTRLALPDTASRVNHLFINGEFRLDSLDARHLLLMVAQGDNAFITGTDLSRQLQDTLHLRTAYDWSMPDTAGRLGAIIQGNTTALHFTPWPLSLDSPFIFTRGGMDAEFVPDALNHAQVLAKNVRGQCVLLRIRHGKGWIYLCSVPKAFTDYYLMKDEARGFMEGSLSLLPDRPVLWDEFYKVGRAESTTPLRFILSRPPLKAAYWATVLLLALYVFVHAKRRQRAIPELAPPRNTSREFAETMGRLYYFNGDHADLAHKIVAQFKDGTRRKLRLHRAAWDEETLQDIAARTGIDIGELRHAARLMEHYAAAQQVSEQQLITLNKTLERLRDKM